MKTYRLYTDGGSRGNPGPGAIGFVIFDPEDNLVHEEGRPIGDCTNNQAEYNALVEGLKCLSNITNDAVLHISDSELLVKQMNGEYRVKNEMLRNLYLKAVLGSRRFFAVNHQYEPRDNHGIKLADNILNRSLDLEQSIVNKEVMV